MPRIRLSLTLCALTLAASAFAPALRAQGLPASVALRSAEIQAGQEKKLVFLLFNASWSQSGRALDAFMADKQIHAILDKYFVPVTIHVDEEAQKTGRPQLNNPGGDGLLARMGSVSQDKTKAVPFFAIVDADGNMIVNSNDPMNDKPGGPNVGYPSNSEQTAYVASMFTKAVPAMTADESDALKKWLDKHDPNFLPGAGGGGGGRRGR